MEGSIPSSHLMRSTFEATADMMSAAATRAKKLRVLRNVQASASASTMKVTSGAATSDVKTSQDKSSQVWRGKLA